MHFAAYCILCHNAAMPLIQVRDLPDHMYRLLAEQAERERRSIAQQVVTVLARGLQVDVDAKGRRQRVLRTLQSDPVKAPRLSDPAKLIRADRRR
jgi:hypothetical protein